MITILGSTGTIGKNTLSVLKNTDKKNKIFALSANKNIKLLLKKFSNTNSRVLITGPSGSGKELCAKFIHKKGTQYIL